MQRMGPGDPEMESAGGINQMYILCIHQYIPVYTGISGTGIPNNRIPARKILGIFKFRGNLEENIPDSAEFQWNFWRSFLQISVWRNKFRKSVLRVGTECSQIPLEFRILRHEFPQMYI